MPILAYFEDFFFKMPQKHLVALHFVIDLPRLSYFVLVRTIRLTSHENQKYLSEPPFKLTKSSPVTKFKTR